MGTVRTVRHDVPRLARRLLHGSLDMGRPSTFWSAALHLDRSEPALATPEVELSVVVPLRDEGPNVLPLLAEIREALDGVIRYEVVTVDDASRDDTLARLQRGRREDPRVRVLRHRTSAGQSAALRTGIRAARGGWIATIDGDLQNDPQDLPRLVARARVAGGAPGDRLIVGHRRRRRDGIAKRVASRVANAVRRRLLGDGTPDSGCGIKVFGREGFLALPYFDHMHRFLPALFRATGALVESVEVRHRPRTAGRSKYGVLDRALVGVVDLFGVAWLQRRASLPRVDEIA